MISRNYTTTFTIQRNVWTTADGYSSSALGTIGTFKGHIQQASPEMVENLGLNFTVPYIAWCDPSTSVKLGDTLVVGTNRYDVRLIQDNSFIGANKHLELILEKAQEN